MFTQDGGPSPIKRLSLLIAIILAWSLATAVPATASARPDPSPPPDRCDIDAFAGVVVVDAAENRDDLAVGETAVVPLEAPIPAGRIVLTGTLFDAPHLDDVPDFTTVRSQFSERLQIRFLGADGSVVGESAPTSDLPDLQVSAPFALPSIDLTAEATGIQLVHFGDGQSPNSISAPCINVHPVAPDAGPRDLIVRTVCPTDGVFSADPRLVCGFLAVPEERSDPDSRLIQVAVGVLVGDGSHPDPVFYLEGGPGGAPLAVSGSILNGFDAPFMEALSGGRDIVLIDQRGTGYSYPELSCGFPVGPASDEEAQAAVVNCVEARRAEGASIGSYTSVESAADIEDLRVALGYGEINLFGGSYGTDLGLTIMRDHPDHIRSSILDSVLPPQVNVFGEQEIGAVKALDYIVEVCSSDPDCGPANPDLKETIEKAYANMDADPILMESTAMLFLAGEPFLIDADGLNLVATRPEHANEQLVGLMAALADDDAEVRRAGADAFFNITVSAIIAETIESFAAAEPPPETSPGTAAIGPRSGTGYWGVPGPAETLATAFNATVICAEEWEHRGQERATQPSETDWSDLVLGTNTDLLASFYAPICEAIEMPAEDIAVTQPVVSDIPSLVLLTDVDTQTVPEWSRITGDTLPNSFTIEFPNLSHVVAAAGVCPLGVAAAFLDDPSVAPDDSCIADLPPLRYLGELGENPGPVDELLELLAGPPPGDGPPPSDEATDEAPANEPPPAEAEVPAAPSEEPVPRSSLSAEQLRRPN